MYKLIIPGPPISKARHRCGCRGKYPVAYDPQTKELKEVRAEISRIWNSSFDDPNSEEARQTALIARADAFYILLSFYMPIPKNEPTSSSNLKQWGIIPCNEKPDFDNLAKFYTDAATGVLWNDDKLILQGTAHKIRYSNNPRTEMVIMPKEALTLDEAQMSVFKTFSPDELREFKIHTETLATFLRDSDYFLEDNCFIPTESFLSEASMLLMDFGAKFGDKLKKVGKLTSH